jgi:hypothetical protein
VLPLVLARMQEVSRCKLVEVELQEVRRLDNIDSKVATSCKDMAKSIAAAYIRPICTFHELDRANHCIRVGLGLSFEFGEDKSVVTDVGSSLLRFKDGVGQVCNVAKAKV